MTTLSEKYCDFDISFKLKNKKNKNNEDSIKIQMESNTDSKVQSILLTRKCDSRYKNKILEKYFSDF